MKSILFIDMLGARRRWQEGGVKLSRSTFTKFKSLIIKSARNTVSDEILSGGIETDSAMIVCSSLLSAVHLAKDIYLTAFKTKNHASAPRIWLRGCIMPYIDSKFLRQEAPLKKPIGNIKVWAYSAEALDAISVEKSGYKGMRLLVNSGLITQSDIDSLRIEFGTHTLIPLTKLRYVGYPKVSEGDYHDLLWMATSDDSEWRSLNINMTSRLRYSSHDSEEFSQAAATQVLFHECAALINSIIGRAKRSAEKRGDFYSGS